MKSFNLSNSFVSVFENYRTTVPKYQISLMDWLTDESRKVNIENIRLIEDKKQRDEIKSRLPCITPSGIFSERKVNGLIEHSGLICIDIDSKDNPHIQDFNWLREEFRKIKNVAYCSLSVSGKGIYCLIPIDFTESHKEHYESLKLDFESLNIVIDKSCGDVSRLRGCSYDDKAFFNEDAIIYSKKLILKSRSAPLKNSSVKKLQKNDSPHQTFEKVSNIIAEIERRGLDITDNYNQWFSIGCALAHEFGEEGREMFHRVSQFHNTYNDAYADNVYSGCIDNSYGYSIGTFFHWCSEYGLI